MYPECETARVAMRVGERPEAAEAAEAALLQRLPLRDDEADERLRLPTSAYIPTAPIAAGLRLAGMPSMLAIVAC